MTDEELKEMEALKRQLISRYLASPEGREKLVASSLYPCEEILTFAKNHPEVFTDASEFKPKVNRMVEIVDRINAALDGTEKYPKQFDKVADDLKALLASLPSDPL
jgi:cytochrome c556